MTRPTSRSSSEFIYSIGVFLAGLISLSCLIALAPISVYLVSKREYIDDRGKNEYISAVKEWNDLYKDLFATAQGFVRLSVQDPDLRIALDEMRDPAPFSESEMKALGLPTYEGLYYEGKNQIVYKDAVYEEPDDLLTKAAIQISTGAKPDDFTQTLITIFSEETRRVNSDAECKGELVGRLLCRSVWRLTGFCLLMKDDGSDSDPFITGKSDGCYPGPSGKWEPGIYDEQVVPSDQKYTLNTTITLRSKRDPFITASFATKGKLTFIETYPVKLILGIVLLILACFMAVICCSCACLGTCLFCHTKRMESKHEYSDLGSSEADGLFANDDQPFDAASEEEDTESNKYTAL